MQVIILTAGLGTRLRPHTFTRPKPLVSVAGKPMLAHVIDSLAPLVIDELVFVTGYLGHQVEEFVRTQYSYPAQFIVQAELRGQAHAIHLTREVVKGPALIVFGDGIFSADLAKLNTPPEEGVIYVQEVEDPRRFGVAVVKNGWIANLIEKPETVVSNLAVIGVYYVPDTARLFAAIDYIIERNIQTKGEYYLADAIQVMINNGDRFRAEHVEVWKDCGTPAALLDTNRYLLKHGRSYVGSISRSVVIPPVYISDSAHVEDSVIGPYVSVAAGARIQDSRIKDSIINTDAYIRNVTLEHSLIGSGAFVDGAFQELNVGDSSELRFSSTG